ncbi:MAG: NAD-dependent protein deacetylase [Candidatus Njordarchaeia archaeon]
MDLVKAARLIANSRYLVAFTGAGISAESGIPTFRGKGGLWEKYDPNEYATVNALKKNPDKVWKLFIELFDLLKKAQPNPAHLALSKLESMGILKVVITQNVDDLHERAGTRNVIKLHGNFNILRCEKCGYKIKIEEINSLQFPKCPKCGGPMRPDVVLFGEKLPAFELERAFEEASKADVLLAVGTSGVVMPAAYIPWLVRNNGGKIIEVNFEPTVITGIAEVSLIGEAGKILPKVVSEVEKILA